MRLIGHLKESSHAAAFGDFLTLEGVENDVEREDDGTYSVWAHDEEAIEKAVRLLGEFQKDPAATKYQGLEAKVREKRDRDAPKEEPKKPATYYGSDTMDARRHGIGQLTLALIIFSGVVFALSKMGSDVQAIMFLFIKSFTVSANEYGWYPSEGLVEVRQGQIWRLVTPIFIHFGFIHILFNTMWLKQLGSAMEHIQGKLFYGSFIVITAAASNFGQYYFSAKMSPAFGGMSGVVFGLFGYVWMKTKFDFMSGYAIDSQSVKMMLVWFVICFSGFLPIANGAHTIGLLVGVVWGYASARGYFMKRK